MTGEPASVRSSYGWCMACPNCGDHEQLDVSALVSVRLMPGMETSAEDAEITDHDWNSDSWVTCGACGHNAQAYKFHRTRQDNNQ